MRYKTIGELPTASSQIIYGCASEPFMAGRDNNALLDAVFAMGINTFDLARQYEGAETSFGKWLASRGNRQDVILETKCAHPDRNWRKRVNEKEIRADFAESSRQLQTDYIDIYLLHRDDPEVDAGEVVEIFNAMYAEGKIRSFGGSNWTHRRIEEANEYAYCHNLIPFTVSSPNYGLADQKADLWGGGGVSISGPSGAEARKWYRETGMPVIAYSSLGRGLFSGKLKSDETDHAAQILDHYAMQGYGAPDNYERLRRCEILARRKGASVSQIALAWVCGQKLNTFAVVSSVRPERMMENIAALDIAMSEEELLWLDLREESAAIS